MTAAYAIQPRLTVEEYLEGEQYSETRHEYYDGRVRAMAGTTDRHNLIAINIVVALHRHLAGGPCRVFSSDLKLKCRHLERDLFYYPDVMVACDPSDKNPLYRERPKLLIEVLSADENRDRVEKYFVYRGLESLEEYALVGQDPEHPEVTLFRRAEGWEHPIIVREGELEFASIGLRLALSDIYRL